MNISKQARMERRTLAAAIYTIENKSTVRETAKHIGVSKSTVHKDLKQRLPEINHSLYEKVANVLEVNREERHMRGGIATKEMYEKAGSYE